ncbi:glyoxylate/hydroxypyruvate reductase A [Sphingobacterium paramultivorum]|uniref:Glyoxylate/hydroxypyruvate reductase A n=1 Tax=Sphingobacterium paramultivorum TaxID=2886510 RepID=A0A7G5EAH7_9SPHI|nr:MULTISPECIES: glyoxylate/hydroxypyruvate reductase A [Sphingobacterium]MCS4164045.1 glyoxylate/hydroxypyruvate reductase A [Sphingobacterium sp. BIGb0116]QMV71002.1 glyoxylate/hydroxypyruvate reductase A [Sphingobacterium paramultivorum]WSO14891.1 glyoxylate/hydroxypyruvate reductase A [Sphingobacterium paramultivorum]
MSIALLLNTARAEEWKVEITKHLPDVKVEIYPEIENYDAVEFALCWKPDANYYTHFPNLKVIQSGGAGIDHLFPNKIPSTLHICRIIDPMLKSDMFEHILTCLMHAMKNFSMYATAKEQQLWQPLVYKSIGETSVTILGLGEIGGYVAERLVQLGFLVKGWSNSPKALPGVVSFSGQEGLKAVVENSGFVVNILPLTDATRGILDHNLFKLCTNGIVLINVGRGDHLVENELLAAIDKGQIAQAYLDVFHLEPLPKDHPFWSCSSIFITPHVASRTNISSSVLQVVDNYKRMIRGEVLLNEVSLEKGY